MRIAHIADIHIGKKLEDFDRNPEIEIVLSETAEKIKENKVKLVLIAGDIFDSPRSSAESQALFYRFLKKLKENQVEKIFIIAGNHDNEALVESAKYFLELSGIHILGKIPQNIDDCFFYTRIEEEEILVVAFPYFSEIPFINGLTEIEDWKDKTPVERYNAIYRVFLDYFKQKAREYAGIKVLMAHLFMENAILSQTEKPSSLESYLCVPIETLENGNPFDYVALGHIHKQQRISRLQPIFYSGSLIRLDFGERRDPKGFYIFDTQTKKTEPVILETPKILEQIEIKIEELTDLEKILSAYQKSSHLLKIKVVFPEKFLPLAVREKIKSLLPNVIKIELCVERNSEKKIETIRAIENAEDLIYYYTQYKKGKVPPQNLELLKEIVEQVFRKE